MIFNASREVVDVAGILASFDLQLFAAGKECHGAGYSSLYATVLPFCHQDLVLTLLKFFVNSMTITVKEKNKKSIAKGYKGSVALAIVLMEATRDLLCILYTYEVTNQLSPARP